MEIDFKNLPVYQHKDVILEAVKNNPVVVIESPTGSGKTTQIPIILHEAGFSQNGIIAVTQPRRIAALSVSEFISKQLGTSYPGLVGYKMRFEDKTDESTRIKIMTDGILLQEMKLDPWMSRYSVVIVDEAHERSLNIDFVLGLLKRILKERSDFKVIVSSATMNTQVFSQYFDNCPIVSIDTVTYPVNIVYNPPRLEASTVNQASEEALLSKIEENVGRILANKDDGDILIFLPGEKVIKDCMTKLYKSPYRRKLHIIPLYGRLAKEEQERVFEKTPFGKKKVVISTNIAETSVTIPGITNVIDSGLVKLNFYSPKTFTSSLTETTISKASCNQRKGRAGRTQSGTCYRLYSKKDFERRNQYTLEEIYRTDLSEVVLRMSELGITDFESFDFISHPGKEGIKSAVETLNLLGALESDNTLSKIGKLMAAFPLEPRLSRIIVEAILRYPDVVEQTIIATSFLSAQSPFILPPGEEMQARLCHQRWADEKGDFVSYLRLFSAFCQVKENESSQGDSSLSEKFCEKNYLDHRVMCEIKNIFEQISLIVSSDLGVPVIGGGRKTDYLTCIASGMIQFVCAKSGRETFDSLTAEKIAIHPSSCMKGTKEKYIVAGEIVKTSRMFAMSVSPLTEENLSAIGLKQDLRSKFKEKNTSKNNENLPRNLHEVVEFEKRKDKKNKNDSDENFVSFGGQNFEIKKKKGKKLLILPYEKYENAIENIDIKKWRQDSKLCQISKINASLNMKGFTLFAGEKLSTIFDATPILSFSVVNNDEWQRKRNYNFCENFDELIKSLDLICKITVAKESKKELGFITLYNDDNQTFWYKVSRGFSTSVYESLSSLERIIKLLENSDLLNKNQDATKKIGRIYSELKTFL